MPQGVLVFAEQRDGNMKKVSLELLNIGKQLAGSVGGTLTAALIGGPGVASLAERLGKAGATKVFVVEGDIFKTYSSEGYAQALVAIVKAADPAVVLAGTTVMGRDLMPRAAAKLGTGIIPDCVELKADGGKVVAKKPVYSGKAYIEAKIPEGIQMLSVRPNSYPPAPEAGGSAEVVKVDAGAVAPKAVVKEVRKAASAKPDLTEAERIVSGGRGIKDKANFKILEDLADVIGATVGASRAAVDSGYAEQSMQVGQTGKVVNPTLYIAAGISGAIQHLAGMRTSKVIVAINKDADAPIFQKADYGIVGDLFKVVPVLTAELKKLMAE